MLRRKGYEMMEVLRGGSMNEGLFLFRDGAFRGLRVNNVRGNKYLSND
jgi:hypothetical protein